MTSTTDTTGHPDVTEISDLTEGLLTPDRSTAVRRHLESCDLCADVHASLEEIRGLLGDLPGPSRMPDDVSHRIDAALAAEALLNATAAEDSDNAPAPAGVHEPADVFAAATEGTTAPDAAGVSRETPPTTDRPSGRPRATTGPGRKDRPGRRRGNRRRAAVLGAVFAAAALGLGSVLVSSLTGGGTPDTATHQTAAPDTFSASKLKTRVTDLLAASGGSRSPSSMGIQGEPENRTPKILRQPTVPPCVQKGIGRSEGALATETGRYQGKDVVLVVLPDATDSTRVDAYIVDTACVDHPSSGPARVLLKTSYVRR
ncbi:anti-sigma factor family protein [Streptomyces sp. NPDC048481]|uniref:anti-sigma factor family protein n=1 Tax=Streptomyces sp. NPDC048481 TaxID=3365557 RepID=UPI003720082C